MEDIFHQLLEGLAGIAEPERHVEELPQAEWCCDGCLGHIPGVNEDLMVPSDEVDFGGYPGAGQASGEILEMENGLAVRRGGLVEEAVVPARAPFTVGLGGHVDGGSPLTAGRPDDPQAPQVLKLAFSDSKFHWGEAAGSGPHRAATSGNAVKDAVCGGGG